ncbi:VOC family protein [Serinibacter salmoneus]|uniref:Putative 3-demethylubiquinone-9 3-methyltransferase (Glyoxalase superfamily) n=1 Tax=Serinibacter salmoneus TaxID=556530 RepID=A0A2A9CX23_9MICO|nr:VOC family protein [Serinibacter salmoneus]PFG18686.1 putative 3-demethylubiquinone-9 3-methyltransferase (glyoxalase superfamily) [Serinibacter salmoneus]
MPTLTPCLWFDGVAEEAAEYYVTVFPRSHIDAISHYPQGAPYPAGTVLTVDFTLDGQRFVALNAGKEFTFSEAISFQIACQDQAEVDYYWDTLTAEGGQEGVCGWLKDRYGVSWQIEPAAPVFTGDAEADARVNAALMGMRKLDLAALEAARQG